MFVSILAVAVLFGFAVSGCPDMLTVDVTIVLGSAVISNVTYSVQEAGVNLYTLNFTAYVTDDIPGNTKFIGCIKLDSKIPTPPICFKGNLEQILCKEPFIADMLTQCSNIKKEVPVAKGNYTGRNCTVSIGEFAPFIHKGAHVILNLGDDKNKMLEVNMTATKTKKCD